MILDIFIPFLIGAVAGCAAVYGITRLKGIWILGALLYLAGGIMVFLCAHLIFYYLVADTHYVFIPGIIGFSLWSALCLCLLWQNVFCDEGFNVPQIDVSL
ncbi:MAG TPA: hypothetical protein PLK01_09785 [Smithellaceae bacterium]|nr:hypothetical protein [Smithellaceae bacterium]